MRSRLPILIILPLQELARGIAKSKGPSIIKLRKLCGKHRTVPISYKLEGVEKEGDHPQNISKAKTTEIWKGRYKGGEVALKVLKVPRDDPQIQRAKSVSGSCDLRRVACRRSDGWHSGFARKWC